MHTSRSRIWSVVSLNSELNKQTNKQKGKEKEKNPNFCFKQQDMDVCALIQLLGVNNIIIFRIVHYKGI